MFAKRGNVSMSRSATIGSIVGFVAFTGFVIYANAALTRLSSDLDGAETGLQKCTVEVDGLAEKLRRAVADRDFAIRRADDAQRLMRSAAAEATDLSFKRLREQDTSKALRAETDRLKASIAELRAAAIETGSIGKPKAEKAVSAPPWPRKRRPPPKVDGGPHEWFTWAAPKP